MESIRFAISFVFLSSSQIFCAKLPVITVQYTCHRDTHIWLEEGPPGVTDMYTQQGDDYTFSSDARGVIVKCTAAFPVYWKLDDLNVLQTDYDASTLDINFFMEREISSDQLQFNNTSTYQYSTTLEINYLSKQLIGNYVCSSTKTDEHTMKKSMYVYLADNDDPPYLMKAGKTVEVETNGRNEIILPCQVFVPNVDVYLFKEVVIKAVPHNIVQWIPVFLNDSIYYDPKIGFRMKVNSLPGILGYYKCTTNETKDVVHINVRKEILGEHVLSEEEKLLHGKAKYYWETNSFSFYCCSNSDKPPQIFHSYCFNVPSCQLHRALIANLIIYNKTELWDHYSQSDVSTNKNCVSQRFYYPDKVSVTVNCRGDGIRLSTDLSFILTTKNVTNLLLNNNNMYNTPYMNYDVEFLMLTKWDGIPLNKAIRIDNNLQLQPLKIYSGQSISLHCRSLEYFFARGIVWAVKMKNGSLDILTAHESGVKEELDGPLPDKRVFRDFRQLLYMTVTSEMDSIICYGPVWNSSEWIPAHYKLDVQESIIPMLEGNKQETYYWTLNSTDMILHCKAHAIPTPIFTWTKDGEELNNITDKLFTIASGEDYSILNVHSVSHYIHGEYICSASNCAGTDSKTFNILVKQSPSFVVIAAASIIFVVFLLGLIFLMVHRMRKQSDTLTNLRTNQLLI